MISTTTHTTAIGDVVVEERHTRVVLSAGPLGAGLAYRRPTSVTRAGRTTPIPDVTMVVRLMALLVGVVIAATNWRRR